MASRELRMVSLGFFGGENVQALASPVFDKRIRA